MSTSNELRVFISSTFRDLQEEREHLIKKIFPEIRSLCQQRGVTFTDVDLRWGLTEEDAMLGQVIRTCLEEVDKCRPFFIGLIGNRYGWAPDLHEVLIDPDLLAKYPWVEEAAIEGRSMTEIEFTHGVFDAHEDGRDSAFFYQRRGDMAEADNAEMLAGLLERIHDGSYPLKVFSDADELGLLVRDDLSTVIERYWPEDQAPTALEIERRAHTAFAVSRRRAYIPNPLHLKEFNRWLAEGKRPLVVNAESGLGKSALAAYLSKTYRTKHPTAVIIEHYIGASEQGGSALSLARRLVEEIRERFAISDEVPSDPQKLLAQVPSWLWRLGHLAAAQGEKVLVVLDALNQLDTEGQHLSWLPSTLPETVKLLLTATPGDALDLLRGRGWEELKLEPIEDERVRQSILLRYLGEFRKGIASEQVRNITSDTKAQSPLYLRVVAEELRLHGEHETLGELIESFVLAHDLDQVFQRMLERMEKDHGAESVQAVLSLIWGARTGLSETELLTVTGISRLDLSRLIFALDYHLLHNDGLLGFFHDFLRRAVEKRYLTSATAREKCYRRLADHFERSEVTVRSTLEALHALTKLDDREGVHRVASTIERFIQLWSSEQQQSLRVWSAVDLSTLTEAYRTGRDRWLQQQDRSVQERVNVQCAVAELYYRLGAWEGSEMWCREGEQIAREAGYRQGLARAVGDRGNVHWLRGENEEALACYREQEKIAQELGDRAGLARAVGNRGSVHWSRAENAEAMACYLQQEQIVRELGALSFVALAVGNRGLVHQNLGELDDAMTCYQEQEKIARQIGNGQYLSLALGNRANMLSTQGEFDEAMACYREQEEIATELGDRRDVGIAIGNRGGLHAKLDEYEEALSCFQQASEAHRDMGFRYGLTYWLGGTASILLALCESESEMPSYLSIYVPDAVAGTTDRPIDWHPVILRTAREHIEECIAISEEISKPDTQASGRDILARIQVVEQERQK